MTRAIFALAAALVFCASSSSGDEPKRITTRDAPVFPRGEPKELRLDPAALEAIRKRAQEADSDAVVIVKDGQLVADWDFGRERGPIEAMSATKSIVSLAIGRLVGSGKIKSLDQPVCDFYPEWKQGRKKLITVRHLLNHTSGIQSERVTTEINASPDFVQLALAAELSSDPGSTFNYNNKAVNLLAGIVERASRIRMDLFIGREIFEPLGITDFHWSLDPAGNPYGMSGLQIKAIDMAKIGQMMLDEGSWNGKQILAKDWVRRSIEPGQTLDPTCGLLWWLSRPPARFAVDDAMVKFFKDRGMTPTSMTKLETLKKQPPLGIEAFWNALRPIYQEDKVLMTKMAELYRSLPSPTPIFEGPVRGYEARGYLGQFLVVVPRHRLVAVRQRRFRPSANPEEPKLYFGDFAAMVASLVIPGPS